MDTRYNEEELTPRRRRALREGLRDVPLWQRTESARRQVLAWLVETQRAELGAEWVDAKDLAEMTAADPPPQHLDRALRRGWRVGYLTPGGAGIVSPWGRGVGWDWPAEGLRAVCCPSVHNNSGGQRLGERPRAKVYRGHSEDIPVRPCMCGLRIAEDLESLVDRFAEDSKAREKFDRTNGLPHRGGALWHRARTPDVFYEAEGWGKRMPDDYHAEAYGPDWRFEYARVMPGGLAHLNPARADAADELAERYGLDVVVGDESVWGRISERRAQRPGVCECGERHYGELGAAGLLLVHDGRVLLQKRSRHVHHGGTWGLPGGAARGGESWRGTAIREAREETAGLRRIDIDVHDEHVVECAGGWEYAYVIADYDGDPSTLRVGSDEATELRWAPLRQAGYMRLHPALRTAWPEVRALVEESA